MRDKDADDGDAADGTGAVARAVVATALDAVGGWLQGLASLIVPERGTFLVAGPIGAALAGKRGESAETVIAATVVATDAADLDGGGLRRTLGEFGFTAEEAVYLEHRLAAGVALVAVTANDEAASQSTRGLFADHDAVYIGTARTDAGLLAEAEALLGAPPEVSSGGDVVVTDAVARLHRVGEQGGSAAAKALRERPVVDEAGGELGRIEDVLVESVDPDGPSGPEPEREVVRYVVVGFGGLLGLGRHRVAVPAPLVTLDADPIRLRVAKKRLQGAPAYDDDAPFSRREETALAAYFGTAPYWGDA